MRVSEAPAKPVAVGHTQKSVSRSTAGVNPQQDTGSPEQYLEQSESGPKQARVSWIVGATSLMFIVLQSLCTAVMAISGVRVVIGLGALAAAGGVQEHAAGWHADAIRIPMMAIAVIGSVVNLFVIRRIRALRSRPSARWRAVPVSAKRRRSENFQIAMAVVSLLLVAAEWLSHHIVHPAG